MLVITALTFYFTFINPKIRSENASNESYESIQPTPPDTIVPKTLNSFYDTLSFKAREPNLNDTLFISKNDVIETFRMIQTHGLDPENKYEIFRIENRNENILFYRKTIQFDDSCATPLIGFDGAKKFSSDCFSLLKSTVTNLTEKQWLEFKSLIQKTDFYFLTIDRDTDGLICDGDYIFIEGFYHRGRVNYYNAIEGICPSDLTTTRILSDYFWKL